MSRSATSSSSLRVRDERLERWLTALLATPGLTSMPDRDTARAVHVEGSLTALDVLGPTSGPIVDVGSGGGSPGFPLAAALPDRCVTLLESSARKAAFLERIASEFPNVTIVCGRAEDQPVDRYGAAVARALAPPPVAAEWCLPLVRPGGRAVLFVGPSADREAVAGVAAKLQSEPVAGPAGLIVLEKRGPTPPGFPRRPGIARKRPLA